MNRMFAQSSGYLSGRARSGGSSGGSWGGWDGGRRARPARPRGPPPLCRRRTGPSVRLAGSSARPRRRRGVGGGRRAPQARGGVAFGGGGEPGAPAPPGVAVGGGIGGAAMPRGSVPPSRRRRGARALAVPTYLPHGDGYEGRSNVPRIGLPPPPPSLRGDEAPRVAARDEVHHLAPRDELPPSPPDRGRAGQPRDCPAGVAPRALGAKDVRLGRRLPAQRPRPSWSTASSHAGESGEGRAVV